MTKQRNLFHLNWQLARFLCLMIFCNFTASGKNTERHLFILSGQSNMTGGLKAGFAKKVEVTYGKENALVVHHSKSGRGIRFWDKDYRFPDKYKFPGKGIPSERSKQQHGLQLADGLPD